MQGVGFPASADVFAELVEGVVHAVVGTDDGDFAAPHQQGNGGFDEFVELVVEGGLVNDDVALFAAQVGGTTGQGGDTVAAGAANDEGEDVLVAVLDNFFCHGFRDQLVMLDPVGCIADKFFGHVLVVADVPHVHAGLRRSNQRGLGGGGPADADAA